MAYTEEDYARARMLSPAYAEKWGAVQEGKNLAQASSGVEQFLKNQESQRQETFRNTPSDVPVPMRAPAYQAPSGIEQFNNRRRAMMQSGNPALQEQAMAMQRTGYKPPAAAPTAKMSTYAQEAKDLGYTPGSKQWTDHIIKRGQPTKMFEDKVTSVADSKSLRFKPEFGGGKVDPGTPWSQIQNQVESFTTAQQKDLGNKKKVGIISSEFDDMLFGDSGIYADRDGGWKDRLTGGVEANLQQFTQTDPRFKSYVDYSEGVLSPLVKSLGEVGSLAEGDVARARALIPVITGLNPDSKSVAQEKLQKLKRLSMLIESKGEGFRGITREEFETAMAGTPDTSGIVPNSQPSESNSGLPTGFTWD